MTHTDAAIWDRLSADLAAYRELTGDEAEGDDLREVIAITAEGLGEQRDRVAQVFCARTVNAGG